MNKILIPSLILLLIVPSTFSQTRTRESLRGLNGVFVYVQPIGKEVEEGGLSRTQIQKAVEKQLQDAGIPLHSEPNPADGSANLAIVIDTLKHPQGVFLYEVQVSLLQEVHLARRQDQGQFPAETWGAKAIGLTTPNRMDLILEPLRTKVADFVADYLAANAKPAPRN